MKWNWKDQDKDQRTKIFENGLDYSVPLISHKKKNALTRNGIA